MLFINVLGHNDIKDVLIKEVSVDTLHMHNYLMKILESRRFLWH